MAERSDHSITFKPSDFSPKERLFVGFRKGDINVGTCKIEPNFFRFPDFSCNWERFSKAEDVRIRENGLPTDVCISLLVKTVQFEKMATPCHDPLLNNYSHTEVRQLSDTEPLTFEPPKDRKLKSSNWSKSKRHLFRLYLVNNHAIEIDAIA
jgi:hypothetical protein